MTKRKVACAIQKIKLIKLMSHWFVRLALATFLFGVTFRTGHKKKCAAHHFYLFGCRRNQGDNKQGGTTAYCSGGGDRSEKLSVHGNVRLRDKAAS